jgi:hypothetical protein
MKIYNYLKGLLVPGIFLEQAFVGIRIAHLSIQERYFFVPIKPNLPCEGGEK